MSVASAVGVRRLLLAGLFAAAASAPHLAATGGFHDPFGSFSSTVSLTTTERGHLDAGEVVVRALPGEGHEIAFFAATRLDAPADALIDWTRAIETLKGGRYVPAIARFSNSPVLADLDALTLETADLESLRRCRPGDCDVKLADAEVRALRLAIGTAGTAWHAAAQTEVRQILFDRVRRYQPEPLDALLEGLPSAAGALVDSFFYWSKEQYGAGTPVIAITHVQIVRPFSPAAPEVIAVSRQVFASHYREASVGLSAVISDWPDGPHYLVYLNRSELDVLGGLLGGLKRRLIEGRVKAGAAATMTATRLRLESGPPPDARLQ